MENKTEDQWIIEFVESNPNIFQQYLFWRHLQDKLEHIEEIGEEEQEKLDFN